MTTARRYCDGRCQGERPCASFAPIEMEGPYARGWRQLLRDVWAWVMGDTP